MFTSVIRMSAYMITASILVALLLGCVLSPITIRTRDNYALRVYGIRISYDIPPCSLAYGNQSWTNNTHRTLSRNDDVLNKCVNSDNSHNTSRNSSSTKNVVSLNCNNSLIRERYKHCHLGSRRVEHVNVAYLPHGRLRNLMIAYITFVSAGLCLSVAIVILTTLFVTSMIWQKTVVFVCEITLAVDAIMCIISLVLALVLIINNNLYAPIADKFFIHKEYAKLMEQSNRSAFGCNITAVIISVIISIGNILLPHLET